MAIVDIDWPGISSIFSKSPSMIFFGILKAILATKTQLPYN